MKTAISNATYRSAGLVRGVSLAMALAVAGSVWSAPKAAKQTREAMLGMGGTVSIGKTEVKPLMSYADWSGTNTRGKNVPAKDGRGYLRLVRNERPLTETGVRLSARQGGKARIDYDVSFFANIETTMTGLSISLPIDAVEGRPWRAGSESGVFSGQQAAGRLAKGRFDEMELPLPESGTGTLKIAAAADADSGVMKNFVFEIRKAEDSYIVRIGDFARRKQSKGGSLSFAVVLSSDMPLAVTEWKPYTISAGKEWIPLDYRRDIAPGSALDFSKMGFADAPAGKYGWLKCVGGKFEFEKLPGKSQRFYGVNLGKSANFPEHAVADALVARFKRLGYNAIRIHHQDGMTVEGSEDGLTLNTANMELLDYLVAAAAREGIYLTIDLYVSRRVKWQHLGIDKEGMIPPQLFKALCAVYEPAFQNWAAYAKNFMEHANKHTGRRYLDEPALPIISLVNEGGLFMGWGNVRTDPRVVASWKAWLEAKRAADPGFAPGLSGDSLPKEFKVGSIHPAIAEWTGDIEAKMFSRMKAYLRGLGCKALLTNDNNGTFYGALQRSSLERDFIDDHFYVDHPKFPERKWSLPSICPNVNPLLGDTSLPPTGLAFVRMLDKPFTVSEWNFARPGRYRGVGGIMAGAMAALQGWDGLWRFAYSHAREDFAGNPAAGSGYFDLFYDPLAQASERACICLFLREDIKPLQPGVAMLVPPAMSGDKVLFCAPAWRESSWNMRTGSCLSPEAAKGFRVFKREEADSDECTSAVKAAETATPPLRIDHARGSMVIDTPRTSGGFAPEGEIDAGALKARISGAPATVWVHSLDNAPIDRSNRLLLTHLTDVQGDGTEFTDADMKILLKWGGTPLVRAGEAKILLRRSVPGQCAVYRLDTAGKRTGRVPVKTGDGFLAFTANTANGNSATILYEICREESRKR